MIRTAEHKDQAKWDEYVLSHPGATPYHLWAWKQSVEQAYGHSACYFLAETDGRIAGVFPLFNLRLPFLLNELAALPFCDVGNCLADSAQIQDQLILRVKEFAEKTQCRQSNLRGKLIDSPAVKTNLHAKTTGKVRMLFPLPNSSEELLASFKSKLRSQIRKAEKNGVQFRWTGAEGVADFYQVYSRNMRDLGSPPHSKAWFRSIMATYGNKARIGLTEYEGKCIGAGLILSARQLTVIPWASTLREYNRLSPNMLLYWNFLQYSADNGFTTFDFGRSTEGEGTFRFKKQWGAQPEPLPWYTLQKPAQQTEGSAQTESASRRTAASILANLPLSVSNFIGPRLRKYISL